VHPQVPPPLEGVAVLLADGHARVGGAHMGKDDGGHDLAGQACQVLIVPAQRKQQGLGEGGARGRDGWVGSEQSRGPVGTGTVRGQVGERRAGSRGVR
jgi:hypothetical protein